MRPEPNGLQRYQQLDHTRAETQRKIRSNLGYKHQRNLSLISFFLWCLCVLSPRRPLVVEQGSLQLHRSSVALNMLCVPSSAT
ncbi:hypothetical protein PBY51_022063 [Eleginops maclovinus]|uniref:Uncharacterized protein n=1 Tax=Eleginops maclovinus TaxID=56733 RepID=A0AAN7XHZ5_ELEMC|nr:hypothetical protein PBY51_022063 [Eleginops maclovinus]